jgi:phosphate-selective porin OprO/OprP
MRWMLWGVLASGAAATAWGQDKGPGPTSTAPEGKPEVATEKAGEKDTLQFNLADGLRFKSGDGNFEGHIGGCLQVNYRSIVDRPQYDGANPRTTPDSFFIRQGRIALDGAFYKDFDYALLFDFPTSTTTSTITGALLDGYVGWKKYPELSLRVGQFKVPFSQEFTTPLRFIDLGEFSVLYRLIPNRDDGVMLYGSLLDKVVQYEVSVFNGNSRDVYDNNDNKDFAARLRLSPFLTSDLKPLKGLRLGAAGTWGHTESTACGAGTTDALDFTTTELCVTFLNATAGALDGLRTRTGFELSWLYGPFSIRAEWMRRRDQANVGGGKAYIGEDAWYVSGTWLLTGEDKALEGRTVPLAPFDPGAGGWGALELAARVAVLDIDDEIFSSGMAPAAGNANKVTTFTLGLNWWLARNLRFAPDFIYEKFNDNIDFGSGVSRDNAKGALVRVQIDF